MRSACCTKPGARPPPATGRLPVQPAQRVRLEPTRARLVEHHPPAAQDQDLIGDRRRRFQIVRHQHHGAPGGALGRQLGLQPGGAGGIQRRRRLVEQQQRRVVRQRACQRQPLQHAARERPRRRVAGHVRQPDAREQLLHPRRAGVAAVQPAEEAQVLLGGEIGVQPRVVADIADLGAQRRPAHQRFVAPADHARRRRHQRGHDPEQGRLARAVGAQHRRDAAGLETGAHLMQRAAARVDLADRPQDERLHAARGSSSAAMSW